DPQPARGRQPTRQNSSRSCSPRFDCISRERVCFQSGRGSGGDLSGNADGLLRNTFSNANIQRLNLEGRLDDLRSGSSGFSSNMKVNGATVNLEDGVTEDGKGSKAPVEQALQPAPENRWGVWVTGFGDFVNVDSDSNANGYDFTTGGFSLGVD